MKSYTHDDMVRIAKRENNTKRSYLVVNRLQGKHIPVKGTDALDVFDCLAKELKEAYKDEKLLIAGFAETATAIGARLAVSVGSYYIQTTREPIDGVDYLYFTESHSHATEQKLVKNDIDSILNDVDRIVFAEDEVTTGNTIMKIIEIIEKTYDKSIKFSVASLLNGMDDDHLAKYNDKGIGIHYLVKTNHDTFTDIADSFKGDGEYIAKDISPVDLTEKAVSDSYINTRRICESEAYDRSCRELADHIYTDSQIKLSDSVLVIGTEEFMYPAVYTAKTLNEKGINAVTHSTTRSPIAVSREEIYPVHTRFELASFYDDERTTFIYDLKKYDRVIVITDSANRSPIGRYSLINALRSVGNDNITIYRWCSDERK